MPYAPAGDAELYYELHGPKPGEAPALVFAHGIGGNHLSWWQQVPHFRTRFTCLVFDHRGFGISRAPSGEIVGATFADDLRAVLDHAGIGRATLVAQSMGGWSCLRFAIEHPDRVEQLVMCDTHGGLRTAEIDAALANAGLTASAPRGVHPAAGARMFEEQPQAYFLFSAIGAINPERSVADMNAIISAAGTRSREDVAALRIPVLFISGEEDIVIPPRVIDLAAACIARARVERVPLAGHSVYFERPDEFNTLVERFLAGDGRSEAD